MRNVFLLVHRLFTAIYRLSVILAETFLVLMVIIVFVNVFMRYVLNSGIQWVEEISLMLAVWFSFVAMAIGVRKGLHISIHLIPRRYPRLDRVLDAIKNLVALGVAYVLVRYGYILVQFTMRSIMPSTRLPSGLLYMVVPVAGLLIIYESLTDLFNFNTDSEASEAEG